MRKGSIWVDLCPLRGRLEARPDCIAMCLFVLRGKIVNKIGPSLECWVWQERNPSYHYYRHLQIDSQIERHIYSDFQIHRIQNQIRDVRFYSWLRRNVCQSEFKRKYSQKAEYQTHRRTCSFPAGRICTRPYFRTCRSCLCKSSQREETKAFLTSKIAGDCAIL